MLTSALIHPGRVVIYGTNPASGRDPRFMSGSQVAVRSKRFSLWNYTVQSQFLKGQAYLPRRSRRVRAGCASKGDIQGLDARSEHSKSANEDILFFFFQLDMATRVQYALNLEQYDIAQQLRDKLNEVENEVIRQLDFRRVSTAKSKVQDLSIHILRLRSQMQIAIQNENYALAAKLRDDISEVEAESIAASAKALAYDSVQYEFRLGQKVRHKIFGYRGVICGMDPVCCESSSWIETAKINQLSRGSAQPFYQVLVDIYEDPSLLVAYVPQENLLLPNPPDTATFDHPYTSFLFYGTDTAGDFIPVQQLREKYNRPRHEASFNPDDEDDEHIA
ncbi:hypothetical protein Drorol1_Dr00018820 [Drosera rotundifolia]